jgi:hypothetical protein
MNYFVLQYQVIRLEICQYNKRSRTKQKIRE